MIWYNGTIKGAIDKVKSSNALLIVFIQGDDDLSKTYETYLNEETKFKPEHYTAVKITHNSLALDHFKKIYVTVPIPSVFFIGANGIPLGIVCSEQPSDLHNAISDAIEKHNEEKKKVQLNQDSQIQSSKIQQTNVEKETEAQKRCQATDSKNCIDCESYKCGKLFLDAKKMMSETSFLLMLLLHEIDASCGSPRSSKNIQSARIQFRLPSMETRSWEFPNLCTLRDVKLYLMETVKLSPGFQLLRTYPRTVFTSEDDDKTLTDLSLTPNSTLIVLPSEDETIRTKIMKTIMLRKNIVLTFIMTIFQPVVSLFSYVRSFILSEPEEKPKQSNKRSSVAKRLNKASTSNIHRLKFDESDSDSDMNVDNGNSTQQK